LSPSNGLDRRLGTLLVRVLANTLLAYAVGAVTAAVSIVVLAFIDPPTPGPTVLGQFTTTMGTLLFGAPLVFAVLLAFDFLVGRAKLERRRMIALGLAILPSVASFLFIPAYPEMVGVTAWLVATGCLFGIVARIP
jgi:hypothetical protein